MDEKIMMIAKRLQALREIMDFTSAQMAEATGLSESEYLDYEAGKNDFSFSFLYSAAGKLGVDIVDLMTGEAPKLSVCSFVKKGHGLKMVRRKEYGYEHLAYIFKNKKMEPFMVTVEPKDVDAKSHMNAHEGQEFDYVVEGRMTLYIDNQSISLSEGDAVYFDAKHKHAMQAEGGVCQFLAIIAK